MHPMLNIAIRAARRAGDIIVRHVDRVDSLEVTAKRENDFVTVVDREAERAIIETIHRAYPQHGILAEETGSRPGDEYTWIIDPLDGTTNFLHEVPHFSVSIAVERKGNLEQAVVYDPMRQELFAATRGGGARLDDRRIRVGRRQRLRGALLGTGFPFHRMADLDDYLRSFKAITPEVAGIRRTGSAALDLAYVACGRFDGFWEFGLEAWDVAAGALLIREAGGVITTSAGGDDYLRTGNVVAGNPRICIELLRRIQSREAKKSADA